MSEARLGNAPAERFRAERAEPRPIRVSGRKRLAKPIACPPRLNRAYSNTYSAFRPGLPRAAPRCVTGVCLQTPRTDPPPGRAHGCRFAPNHGFVCHSVSSPNDCCKRPPRVRRGPSLFDRRARIHCAPATRRVITGAEPRRVAPPRQSQAFDACLWHDAPRRPKGAPR